MKLQYLVHYADALKRQVPHDSKKVSYANILIYISVIANMSWLGGHCLGIL